MELTARAPGFVLLLVALASLLLGLIIAPFAAAFFAAAVLAGVLHPVQARLAEKLGDRPGLAAGLLTLGTTLVAVGPLAALLVFVAQEATVLLGRASDIYQSQGVDGLVDQLPVALQGLARRLAETWATGPGAADPGGAGASRFGDRLATAADVAAAVLDGLGTVLLDLAILMVTLFFLLKEGARLVQWIVAVLPLSTADGNRLVAEFRDVTRAVFIATVVTAFVQTAVAAVGYWIAGISYVPIALLLTFIAALVPVLGAAVVVIVVGVFVWLYGDPGHGIFLIVWGVVPVGVIDNFIKPMLAKGRMHLPAPVVLFAMLGGVAVFGPLGIVAGPLIVAFFLAALRLLRREGVLPSGGAGAAAAGHG